MSCGTTSDSLRPDPFLHWPATGGALEEAAEKPPLKGVLRVTDEGPGTAVVDVQSNCHECRAIMNARKASASSTRASREVAHGDSSPPTVTTMSASFTYIRWRGTLALILVAM